MNDEINETNLIDNTDLTIDTNLSYNLTKSLEIVLLSSFTSKKSLTNHSKLLEAASNCDYEYCYELIQKDISININIQDDYGRDPLLLVLCSDYLPENIYKVVFLLIEYGSNIEDIHLIVASQKGFFRIVDLFLETGFHYYVRDTKERTPLILAAICDDLKTVKVLLKYAEHDKLFINHKDIYGKTAYWYVSSSENKSKLIDVLLKVL